MSEKLAAFAALRLLIVEKAKAKRLQSAFMEVYPDDHFYAIPSAVETALVKLIDAIIGPGENAAYLLYEAMSMKNGGCITVDGRSYPIRDVDDLEAYIAAEHAPLPQQGGKGE